MGNIFNNIQFCSLKGTKDKNEDFFYADNSLLIVGDGATGIGENFMEDKLSDAAWFSRAVINKLKVELKKTNKDIPEVLQDIIEELKELYLKAANDEFNMDYSPSMSIIIFREIPKDNKIEIFSLGDCTAFIEDRNGAIYRMWDQAVPNLDNNVLKLMKKELKNKCFETLGHTRSSPVVKKKLRDNRSLKNTKQGYWILDISGEGISHAQHTYVDYKLLNNLIVMTDGYYDGLKIYKEANYRERDFYETSKIIGIEKVANFIRETFNSDIKCEKFERVTALDDITVISAQINEKHPN